MNKDRKECNDIEKVMNAINEPLKEWTELDTDNRASLLMVSDSDKVVLSYGGKGSNITGMLANAMFSNPEFAKFIEMAGEAVRKAAIGKLGDAIVEVLKEIVKEKGGNAESGDKGENGKDKDN